MKMDANKLNTAVKKYEDRGWWKVKLLEHNSQKFTTFLAGGWMKWKNVLKRYLLKIVSMMLWRKMK